MINRQNYSEAQMIAKIFEGAKKHRGILTSTGSVYEDKAPIDWQKHINGELRQGLSPVDEETRLVRFYGVDIDIVIPPKEIGSKVWEMLGTEYFCVMTKSKRWRIVGWNDEPMDVTLANTKAKQLEKEVERVLLYKCDTTHTLPVVPRKEDHPGSWWFMPFFDEHEKVFTPDGKPMSLKQFYFAWRYRNFPVVRSAIGIMGADKDGTSRHKALFNVALNKKHDENLEIDLYELNEHFGEPLKDTQQETLKHAIEHAEKSADKYNKEHFLKNQINYIVEHCGINPCISAKNLSVIASELVKDNIYVMARTDFWSFTLNDWIDKEQMNDLWAHTTNGPKIPPMSKQLLGNEKLVKVKSYLCHAGLKPGVIDIKPREVPGISPGKYLNTYKPVHVASTKGDISLLDEYYTWLLGEDNWNIIKQLLRFMLIKPGVKIMWCVVIKGKVQGAGKGLLALLMESLFGSHNVKINVTFNDLTRDHSTIVDGKQLIVLNELVLQGGGREGKVLSNKIKPYITDPTLIINPKGKKEIEIPNFCIFFMFSNDRKPMRIDPEDRRLFVITIKWRKDQVREKLDKIKPDILKHIKDPSAFKWHLLNEVEIPNEEVFFTDPPMNADKEQLIKDSMDDFEKKLTEALDEGVFPFRSKQFSNGDVYGYKGMIHRDDLDKALKQDKSFRGVYWDLLKIDEILDEITVKKVQLRCPDGTRPRVYITNDLEVDGKKLSDMTDGELGKIFSENRFVAKDEHEHFSDKEIQKMFDNPQTERTYEALKIKNVKQRETRCWDCGSSISTEIDGSCNKCNTGIPCGECGSCICERPKDGIDDTY